MLLDRAVDLQRELGLYEVETRSVYEEFVRPGTSVLDVGCGDGYEALACAARGARVVAWDASKEAIDRLKANLALNPALAERVEARCESFPPRDGVPTADFAKVDIDGGERDALEHLLQVPVLLVETHSSGLEQECAALLAANAYDIRIIRNAWWRFLWPEERPIDHNRWLLATAR